jgi:hypothetical protein
MRPHVGFRQVWIAACLLLNLPGCITVEYGTAPHVDSLSTLTPGIAGPADVLQTLGEPRGKGRAHLRVDLSPRDVWFYESVRSNGKAVDLKILLVFFLDDRYDGYMWFASTEEFERLGSMEPAR